MEQKITLAHGSGGKTAGHLIDEIINELGTNKSLLQRSDGAVLESFVGTPIMTTDGFVVSPRKFPGGNIGKLCVAGTVNDLLAAGAKPEFLSLGLIIEDGFSIDELRCYLKTINITAKEAGVEIVCGDTKVVEHGAADGLFITTTGIGKLVTKIAPGPHRLNEKEDLSIILSGTIGDHELTLLGCRKELSLDSPIQSDCAPLTDLILSLLETCGDKILCMRDPTRGGLAAILGEIANQSNTGIEIIEEEVPINPIVRGACDLLGIDPFAMANEGKMVFFVEPEITEEVLVLLKNHALGKNAAKIGQTTHRGYRPVYLTTSLGVKRPLEIPLGEMLPRIC